MTQTLTPVPRKSLKVLIVRHGQTDYNIKRILQGHLDTPLNASGQSQAVILGKYFKSNGIKIDAVFASDLQRVISTTNLILSSMGLVEPGNCDSKTNSVNAKDADGKRYGGLEDPSSPNQKYNVPIVFTAKLRERDMGELETMYVHEAHAKAQREGKTFENYGESYQSIRARLRSMWSEIIAQAKSHPDWSTILIVSHGGAISKLCVDLVESGAVKLDDSVPLASVAVPANTSVTELVVPLDSEVVDLEHDQGQLMAFGSVEHLKVPVETFQDEQ